jgi:hypothetical protein
MIKLLNLLVDTTPGLTYHLKHGLPLSENIYRYSSNAFIQLFTEARSLHRDGYLQLCENDRVLLEETDIGEYGMYEGQKVPLDLPMAYEQINPRLPRAGEYGGNIRRNMTVTDKDNNQLRVVDITDNKVVLKPTSYSGPTIVFPDNYDQFAKIFQFWDYFNLDKIEEAEYKGKDVALNKPKRGGPKKFYVYVKNPKTGNVKKVNFGDSGNLTVKLNEPGARAAFAARHKCAMKKDKTSPGYWSCNIGRYWKSLGGSKNFSGYW